MWRPFRIEGEAILLEYVQGEASPRSPADLKDAAGSIYESLVYNYPVTQHVSSWPYT